MTAPATAFSRPDGLDLSLPSPFADRAARLERLMIESSYLRAVENLAEHEHHLKRVQQLCETFRELEPADSARLLMAAAKYALRGREEGLRVLFGFLNVKQPGVEVLRQLQKLTSLERAALRLTAGSWKEPEGSGDENPAFAILEVLQEATRLGVLEIGLDILPRDTRAIRSTVQHLRYWHAWMTVKLAAKETLPEDHLQFLVQLSMLEIHLTEKRISRIAESIDPYDSRGMARLMPVMSRYDQDIEHMKTVISRLTTYMPFYERLLTLETALTDREMDKIEKELTRHPVANVVGELISRVRANPVLDREYFYLVSVIHQTALLRAQALELERAPDLLSTMIQVLDNYVPGLAIPLILESEVLDSIWPVIETWGVFRRVEDELTIGYREDRSIEFIERDGVPRLPEVPQPRLDWDLSLEEMVRLQMGNDPFLLGVLDNPRAAQSRVVPLIATHCRSIRVLEKIARDRILHTGVANKDVPRLLLLNPTRLPINTLRRFIHVRFVSRMDLHRMSMPTADIRPEIRQEIVGYLRSLKN